MRKICLAILLFAMPLAAPVVLGPAWAGSHDVARIVFDEVTRRIVHEYYGVQRQGRMSDADTPGVGQGGKNKGKAKTKGKNKTMPPGLARRANLPPGLQRHLDSNGRLPPGLAKRDLPGDLRGQLPRLRSGLKRVIVDRDVLLIEAATGLVLDVIAGVVRSK